MNVNRRCRNFYKNLRFYLLAKRKHPKVKINPKNCNGKISSEWRFPVIYKFTASRLSAWGPGFIGHVNHDCTNLEIVLGNLFVRGRRTNVFCCESYCDLIILVVMYRVVIIHNIILFIHMYMWFYLHFGGVYWVVYISFCK